MATYVYTGRDARGRRVSGSLESLSPSSAADELAAEGITPVRIDPGAESSAPASVGALWQRLRGRHASLEDLVVLCQQLYALTRAGAPIINAIQGVAQSTRSPGLRATLHDVVDDLESGQPLASCLQSHPRIFGALFVSMVHVGENTGRLEETFKRLADYLELERSMRKRVAQATRYPSFVLIAIAVAVGIVNFFVIPQFAEVFARFDTQLPWPTRLLIALSDFFIAYWWALLLALVALVVAGIRALYTATGRLVWHRVKLRLPVVGGIFRRIALGRFARSFSMALRSGVPVLSALDIVARAVNNDYIAGHLRAVRRSIEGGEPLTRAARSTGIFSPLVLQMMAVGEETGALDELLEQVADFYDLEVDYDLRRLADRIEPILLVIIGAMVLLLALGVFLPMWDLATAVRNR